MMMNAEYGFQDSFRMRQEPSYLLVAFKVPFEFANS